MIEQGIDGGVSATITEAEFESLRKLIHSSFGINLTQEKRTLVVGRLQKLLRERGNITFGTYYQQVIGDGSGREMSELVNRISTNHTFFNREKEHFDFFLKQALPDLSERARRKGTKALRVWCAASSTGEEPYMLAMLMREFFGKDFGLWDLGLLATDISATALETAKAGIYTAERAGGLPPDLLKRYFVRRADGDYEASPQIKSDITYRRFNLIADAYPFKAPFDAIFCRNVMIYFDGPTKDGVVRNMEAFLKPGGYFFIGHSETLGRQSGPLKYLRPALYQKTEAP